MHLPIYLRVKLLSPYPIYSWSIYYDDKFLEALSQVIWNIYDITKETVQSDIMRRDELRCATSSSVNMFERLLSRCSFLDPVHALHVKLISPLTYAL